MLTAAKHPKPVTPRSTRRSIDRHKQFGQHHARERDSRPDIDGNMAAGVSPVPGPRRVSAAAIFG